MKEFFSDSRALFSEHSIGTTEFKVTEESEIGQQYKAFLGGFYSVCLNESANKQLPAIYNSILKQAVYKIIKSDGTYAYVFGLFDSVNAAKGEKRFLEDCQQGADLKVVFVTPKEFKIINE
jgi:hypothetical protein